MTDKYILKGKTPVPCADLMQWGKWLEGADRVVAKTVIGPAWVSTVFLGLDHSFGGPVPILFETMIFGNNGDEHCERTATWEDAEEAHKKAVALVEAGTANALAKNV